MSQEWILTDDSSGVRRIVVGHFNWSGDEAVTLTTPLEKMGLDPTRRYVGFDYWADRFLAPVTTSFSSDLPAASCKIISLYEQRDYPQLVSTSRHVTQGVVDVLQEKWDAGSGTLSGISRVVAGDPYELRVVVPRGDERWKVASATIDSDGDAVTWSQDGTAVRAKIEPKVTGELHWSISFGTKR